MDEKLFENMKKVSANYLKESVEDISVGDEVMVSRDPNPAVKAVVTKIVADDVAEVEYEAPETGIIRTDRYYFSQLSPVVGESKVKESDIPASQPSDPNAQVVEPKTEEPTEEESGEEKDEAPREEVE